MAPIIRVQDIKPDRKPMAEAAVRVHRAPLTQVWTSEGSRVAHSALKDLGPGCAAHVFSDGWCAHDVVMWCLEACGPDCRLTMTTWAIGAESLDLLTRAQRAGWLKDVYVLADSRFKRLVDTTYKKGETKPLVWPANTTIRVGRTHAKVYVVSGPTDRIAITSSGNLTRNRRAESYVITRDDEVAEFYEGWIRSRMERGDHWNIGKQRMLW